MRPFIAALVIALLAPISAGQVPTSEPGALAVEELLKALRDPGLYLDSFSSAPRLVRIAPAKARPVEIRVKREPEPVVARYPGARASVRANTAQPVFYLYKNKPDVWFVKLAPKGEDRELLLGTVSPNGRGSTMTVQIRNQALSAVVDALRDDLHRVVPASPLAGGEYALVSDALFVETIDRFVLRPFGGSVRLTTAILDFGVDAP
jgi:hypothetical protein